MKKIASHNYKERGPGGLADLLVGNAGLIVEQALPALVDIFGYIMQAIGERRKLRGRVDVLEAALKAQIDINKKMADEIDYLKTKTK